MFSIRLDEAAMNIESGWPADIRRSRNISDFRRRKAYDAYQQSFDRLVNMTPDAFHGEWNYSIQPKRKK